MPPPPSQHRQGSGYGGLRIPPDETGPQVLERHPAYEPTVPPAPELPGPPSFAARASQLPLARLLALIAAAATGIAGIVTAIGGATVSIIAALRPSSEAEAISKRLGAVETRVQGDFGLGLEEKARRAKDDELTKALETANSKAAACDGIAARVQKLEDGKGRR